MSVTDLLSCDYNATGVWNVKIVKECFSCCAGLMLSSQFPVNYFSISELDQAFPDFQELYASTGKRLEGDGKFWRFNKLHDYGYKGEDAQALSNMFKLKEEVEEEVESTA